jgi:hypothetical protein
MAKATERVVGFNPPSEGYWIIPSETGDILLANTLLPPMTQDKSATYASKGGFHSMSMPEHFELAGALYELRNKGGEAEQARQFIQASMRASSLNTQTRLIYTPRGDDRIIHGYGTGSPIEKNVELVGGDGNVLEVLTPSASLALTGKTPEQVTELLQYINETPAYVWRLNKKPASIEERVARLYADSGRANLVGYRDPQGGYPSLGVRYSREAQKK